MENEIELIRKDVKRYFHESGKLPEREHYVLSNGGLYYFTATPYKQNDPSRNWIVSKIEIWNIEASRLLFHYLRDDDLHCGTWVQKQKKDYLFLPECSQGQSVFDVSENRLYSFYSSKDPFIWLGVFPSPDANRVAVDGCYWGCPNELRVFDISEITKLPYPMIYQEHNFDQNNKCVFESWSDNNTLVVCRNEKEIAKIEIAKEL